MTALLIVLNLTGSRVAGQAQNFIVILLLVILAVFIGRGAFSASPGMPFRDFAPFGWGAVAGGTATLFVTYAGFAGIASVAEEIRDPGQERASRDPGFGHRSDAALLHHYPPDGHVAAGR